MGSKLGLVPTVELMDEIERRFNTSLFIGITIDSDVLSYYRHICGKNSWALALPLLNEIERLKDNMKDSPDVTDAPIDFG